MICNLVILERNGFSLAAENVIVFSRNGTFVWSVSVHLLVHIE